jgi:hypothetical protein
MEVLGKVKVINATQQVSATFNKRELVVTTNEQYPQHILIEFAQDKCDLLNNYKVGDSVKISINLRGREWVNPQGEMKYFNQIQGWKIDKTESEAPVFGLKEDHVSFRPVSDFKEEDHDDLPF